jgi:hypothetical protein
MGKGELGKTVGGVRLLFAATPGSPPHLLWFRQVLGDTVCPLRPAPGMPATQDRTSKSGGDDP